MFSRLKSLTTFIVPIYFKELFVVVARLFMFMGSFSICLASNVDCLSPNEVTLYLGSVFTEQPVVCIFSLFV